MGDRIWIRVVGAALAGTVACGAALALYLHFAGPRPRQTHAPRPPQRLLPASRPQEGGRGEITPIPEPGPETALAAETARPALPSCTIVVDPGHPSERNSGKTMQNGTTEVHIAWQVAVRLRDLLQARGARVVMTKSREDEYVTNKDRALTANREKADLFLRLHCDASAGSGYAVYYPDRQGTVQGKTGPSTEVISRSREAARLFHQGFAQVIGPFPPDNGVRGDSATLVGSRQGALTGSIFSEVPALTVEMCVLSNSKDAEFVKSEAGQARLAEALAQGAYVFVTGRGKSPGKALRRGVPG